MTLVSELRAALREDAVLTEPAELRTYECDGLTGWRAIPQAVVLPRSTQEVAAAVRVCDAAASRSCPRCRHRPLRRRDADRGGHRHRPGADEPDRGVDVPNRRARVQPGVPNLEVSRAVAPPRSLLRARPSSQQVCTIGGNVAENSGGAHCLKYGFTTNHVLELEVVLADGERGHAGARTGRLDLVGGFVGSEGTLGIVTEVVVRLLPLPERVVTMLAGVRRRPTTAGEVVSAIIAAGICPPRSR